jgi:hypothetical protein
MSDESRGFIIAMLGAIYCAMLFAGGMWSDAPFVMVSSMLSLGAAYVAWQVYHLRFVPEALSIASLGLGVASTALLISHLT